MTDSIVRKDWAHARRRAMTPTEVATALSGLEGWTLDGTGEQVAIQKTFRFPDYFQTIAFVNAVAFVAHVADHHPDLTVGYSRCTVRFNTHDVQGLSATDFECAAKVEACLR